MATPNIRRFSLTIIALIGITVVVTLLNLVPYLDHYLPRLKAADTPKPTIPQPVVVMDGFDVDRVEGRKVLGAAVYDETRSVVNVAIGDLEPRVQRGEITRAQAQQLIAEFKSEGGGKLYVERVQATKDGNTNPNVMVEYWSKYLDIYDGIFINEYTHSTAVDGQSQNAIETLRRIRQKYPNKIIMPAVVEAVGFSGTPNPFYNNEVRSYKAFLQAARDYTDLIFYEFYLYTGQDEYAFVGMTRNALTTAAPGILPKTFYGLYIPQTIDTILDDKGVDAHPDKSLGHHFQKQYELINAQLPDIAGIGFWVYYRSSHHVLKTITALTKNCYLARLAKCGDLPPENLLKNGSFEQGTATNLTNWSLEGTVRRVDYLTTKICSDLMEYSSSVWCQYLHLGGYAGSLEKAGSRMQQTVAVTPGASYHLKGYFRPKDVTVKPVLRVRFGNGMDVATDLEPVVFDPAGSSNKWRMRHMWFTVPSGVTQATISVENATNSTMYVDGVKLEKTLYDAATQQSNPLVDFLKMLLQAAPRSTPAPMSMRITKISPFNPIDNTPIRIHFEYAGPVKWVNLKIDYRELGGVLQAPASQGYIDIPANHELHVPGTHVLSVKPYNADVVAGPESEVRYVTIRTNQSTCAASSDSWYSCRCADGSYGGYCYPSQPEKNCSCSTFPQPTVTPTPAQMRSPAASFGPTNYFSPMAPRDSEAVTINFYKNEDVNYVNLRVDSREETKGVVVQLAVPLGKAGMYSVVFPANHPLHIPGTHTLGLRPYFCDPQNNNACTAGGIQESTITISP